MLISITNALASSRWAVDDAIMILSFPMLLQAFEQSLEKDTTTGAAS